MKEKIVRHTWDSLPPVSPERVAELKALAARPDSEIDFSDIPELTAEDFKRAVRGRFGHLPKKAVVTVRLDEELISWLATFPEGMQAKMNALLRAAFLEDKETRPAKGSASTASADSNQEANTSKELEITTRSA